MELQELHYTASLAPCGRRIFDLPTSPLGLLGGGKADRSHFCYLTHLTPQVLDKYRTRNSRIDPAK